MSYRKNRKDYFRTKIWDYRRKMKIKAIEYKGNRCEICSYDRCVAAMEFHHPNPNGKDFNVSHGSYGWDRIKKEIDKCQLLCCRCHREIHAIWDSELTDKLITEKTELKEQLNQTRIDHIKLVEEAHSKVVTRLKTKSEQSNIDWPDRDELAELLEKVPIARIAKQLGVSDQSVYRKVRLEGLQTKPIGYWSTVRSRALKLRNAG